MNTFSISTVLVQLAADHESGTTTNNDKMLTDFSPTLADFRLFPQYFPAFLRDFLRHLRICRGSGNPRNLSPHFPMKQYLHIRGFNICGVLPERFPVNVGVLV